MNVPFVESRSTSIHTPSRRCSFAWLVETDSSGMTRSVVGPADVDDGRLHAEPLAFERAAANEETRQGSAGRPRRRRDAMHRLPELGALALGRRCRRWGCGRRRLRVFRRGGRWGRGGGVGVESKLLFAEIG